MFTRGYVEYGGSLFDLLAKTFPIDLWFDISFYFEYP